MAEWAVGAEVNVDGKYKWHSFVTEDGALPSVAPIRCIANEDVFLVPFGSQRPPLLLLYDHALVRATGIHQCSAPRHVDAGKPDG